jgi:type I restriction enzyme, S subunit
MSEQTSSNVPQIRFSGFSGAWGRKSLGEVCVVGDADHWMPKTTSHGIPYVMTGDFFGINGIDFKNAKLISEADFEKLSRKIQPEHGDILFARYASIGSVRYINAAQKFIASYSCAILKCSKFFDGEYLFFLLQAKRCQNQLKSSTNTGSQGNVGIDSIKQLTAYFPKKSEQEKIAKFLSSINEMLEGLQRKHDKLVTLKKAMLQKMFPQPGATTPEIRFKGFEGDWVERKLGESTVNVSNNTLSRANLNSRSGVAKNIHYGDILVKYGEVLDVQDDDVPFVSDDALANKLKHARLQDGDVVIADAAEDEMVGKCTEIHNVCDQVVLAGLHTIALRPLDAFAPHYLGYFLNADAFHDQLLRLMQGTKVLSISKTVIKETIVYFPTHLAEQQKIGTYFRTLDELISQHATQLQKLQQIKSACLERMFV